MEIINCKIDDLIHPEYNPRKISDHDFKQLKLSLNKFEAVEPAIININPKRKNIIIGGNQRISAAKDLGWEVFPCVVIDLSLKKEKELNIRLNRNVGTWDYNILDEFFNNKEDLLDFGFTNFELNGIGEKDLLQGGEKNIDVDFDTLEKQVIKCPKCKHEWYNEGK